jgi:hypothetical protein
MCLARDFVRIPKPAKIEMSLAIRRLPKEANGQCALCETQGELLFWDSNLGGRVCSNCVPFLEVAEIELVAAKCGHPDDMLVYRNP